MRRWPRRWQSQSPRTPVTSQVCSNRLVQEGTTPAFSWRFVIFYIHLDAKQSGEFVTASLQHTHGRRQWSRKGFLPKKTLCNDRGLARERTQGTSPEKVFEVNVVVFSRLVKRSSCIFHVPSISNPDFSCRGWNRNCCNALDSNFKGAFWKNVRIKHRDPNAIAGR